MLLHRSQDGVKLLTRNLQAPLHVVFLVDENARKPHLDELGVALTRMVAPVVRCSEALFVAEVYKHDVKVFELLHLLPSRQVLDRCAERTVEDVAKLYNASLRVHGLLEVVGLVVSSRHGGVVKDQTSLDSLSNICSVIRRA
jgi:hypothetical protein